MCKLNCSNDELNRLWEQYIEVRVKGLKKYANKLLNELIDYLEFHEDKWTKEFVNYICDLKFEQNIDIDLQYPLVKRVIFPVLLTSIENKSMPQLRWLYQLDYIDSESIIRIEEMVGSEFSILEMANMIEPDDLKTVKLMIDYYFNILWYGSHHMPDFILEEKEEVNHVLSKVNDIIHNYTDSSVIHEDIIKTFNYYTGLYDDWFCFHEREHDITFNEWCIEQKKNYSWVKSYYYNK